MLLCKWICGDFRLYFSRLLQISCCYLVLCSLNSGFVASAQSSFELSAKDLTSKTQAKLSGIKNYNPNDINAAGLYVQNNPNDARGHFWLAKCYEAFGYGNLAADEYLKANDLDKQWIDPLIALVRLKFRASDANDVIAIIINYKSQYSKNAEALFQMAMAINLEAHRTAMRASEIPKSPRKDELEKTAKEYFHLADDLIARCQSLNSNSARISFWRANTLFYTEQYKQALVEAQKATADKQLSYLANGLIAKCYRQLGQMQPALEYAGSLYHSNPWDVDNSLLYAETLVQCQKLDQAFEPALYVLVQTIGSDPEKLVKARRLLVHIIKDLPAKKRDEIIEKFAFDIRNTAYLGRYHLAMGDLFDRTNMREKAIQHYKVGVKLEPTFARGYLRLAEDQEAWQYNFDEAKENYRQAFNMQKNDPEIDMRVRRFVERYRNKSNDLALRLKLWLNANRSTK
jgi:Tfp pilus assembly protein PilF